MKRFIALFFALLFLNILSASAKDLGAVPYKDNFFSSSPLIRNDALAYASAVLADAAYQPGRIGETLWAMGFDLPRLDNYQVTEQGLTDYAASAMSRKSVALDGETFDLFTIIVRGTYDDIEWASNLHLGAGWDHAGFVQAESDLMENFRAYYTDLEKSGKIDRDRNNNIIWVTGHSRGAAIANLLAVQLRDYSYCPDDQIYTYTFSCPRVTRQPIDQSKYRYIHNYNILADLIPHLPPSGPFGLGYQLYGNVIELESFTGTHDKVVKEYEKTNGSSYNVLDKVMNHKTALYLCWMKVLSEGSSEAGIETQTVKPGDILAFGHYEQDNNLSNGREPIQWRVLAREGSKALLISVYNLDAQLYNTAYTSVTWETCTLRRWLNDSFLSTAFTQAQRNAIVISTLQNDKNSEYNTPGGNATQDKIFLLSEAEAEQLFTGDSDRIANNTAYTKAQGAYTFDSGAGWWWLRSPGHDSYFAAYVRDDGSLYLMGFYVDRDVGAVRPALWIDLSSI